MKKSNFVLATVAAVIVSTSLFAQTGPPETPWLLQGNSNVDQNINYLGTTNNEDLIIKTNATQRMVVSGTSGNVGIGVITPMYPLHITSDTAMRSLNITNTTPGPGYKYGVYSKISGSGSGPKFGGWFESKSGSGLNYGIKATGNGTGTNYGVNAVAQGNSLNYGIYAKALGGFSGLGVNYAVYGEVQANLSNSWAGYFLGRGYFSEKVGIGTTTMASGYMLSVGGKIMCEELKVQLEGNWPDYVFDESYALPTLSELEQHIQSQKHLPGIPSAAEIKNNGIAVGEMQTKMMEKIEELTLYVIQLEKKINALNKK